MSFSLMYASVDATRSLPELYAPAGGRPPSLTTEGEDLTSLDQRPQATAGNSPAPNSLPAVAAAGSTAAAAGPDTVSWLSPASTSLPPASRPPSAAATYGRDTQLGTQFDTLA
jgi:hypothetical protein